LADNLGEQAAPEDMVPLKERMKALLSMVSTGLDEATATLTLVEGIGAHWARRLREAGIADVEDLALAEASDLGTLPGLSRERAERWISQATQALQGRSAFSYRETGPTAGLAPSGWPSEVDPYRLRRAIELKVMGVDGTYYQVSGGLEPHRVWCRSGILYCDCPDGAKGHECKHLLAVRLHKGDTKLRRLVGELRTGDCCTQLNVFDLWFQSCDRPSARRP
jgi:predicted flap endonuclease-1-like 5' DNA nuclease